MARKVVVAGGLGVVGRAAVERFASRGDTVVALSRRAPPPELPGTWLAVDLRDAPATRAALAPHRDASHVVYAALHEKPELVRGWFDPDHVRVNLAMLEHLQDAVEGPGLRHVSLLQGTKAYGVHLGRGMRLPAKERQPRVQHENFYFHQEDWLRARQAAGGFRFTILRPQIVLGVATGSAMNVVATLGAYAALCRELGQPLVPLGHPDAVVEATDARLLARALDWAADAAAAANQVFNVTDGDVLCWSELFSPLARAFDVPLGERGPQGLRLAEQMPRHAEAWRRLAEREGLREPDLASLVGLSWQYADATWASPQLPQRPPLVSTVRVRQAGFGDCIDSEDAVFELLGAYRRLRYLPD